MNGEALGVLFIVFGALLFWLHLGLYGKRGTSRVLSWIGMGTGAYVVVTGILFVLGFWA